MSIVGTGDHHLSNTSPTTLLLAGHATILSALAIAATPAIGRWAQRPRVWWWTALGNSGAMTLYLWHIPAPVGSHLLFDELGLSRYPGQPHFAVISIAQLLLMGAMVATLFAALRPLENNPLPGWDGAPPISPAGRGAAVGTLLCLAGAATLAFIHRGLKDQGLIYVTAMVTALVAARALAGGGGSTLEIATARGSNSVVTVGVYRDVLRGRPAGPAESPHDAFAKLHQPLVVDRARRIGPAREDRQPFRKLIIRLAGQQDPDHQVPWVEVDGPVMQERLDVNPIALRAMQDGRGLADNTARCLDQRMLLRTGHHVTLGTPPLG